MYILRDDKYHQDKAVVKCYIWTQPSRIIINSNLQVIPIYEYERKGLAPCGLFAKIVINQLIFSARPCVRAGIDFSQI